MGAHFFRRVRALRGLVLRVPQVAGLPGALCHPLVQPVSLVLTACLWKGPLSFWDGWGPGRRALIVTTAS
jgi:hypothetical protein